MRATFASLALCLLGLSSTAYSQIEPLDFPLKGRMYRAVTVPTWEDVVANGMSRQQTKRAQAIALIEKDRIIDAQKAKEKLLVEQVETARQLLKDCDLGYWEAVGENQKLQRKKRRKNRTIAVLGVLVAGFVAKEAVPLLSR